MMTGPKLGNSEQLDVQQLYDAMQVHIADMGDDKRLSGLLMDFSNTSSALRTILGDLNSFADDVKTAKPDTDHVISTLRDIAEKAFRELGKMRDEDLQRKGTDYQAARWAFLKHFYSIARTFGAQVELANLLDKWEKEHPHTEDPKEQTFQEQKEAAFKLIESRFPTMYAEVTGEVGFEADKVLEGSMNYIDDKLIGNQSGPLACYFGVAYNSKWNSKSNLPDAEKAKRVEIMKAKLLSMISEAIARDARRATKTVFDLLVREMYSDLPSVQGKSAGPIADEMIALAIRKRCKSDRPEYAAYKPLVYYWSSPNVANLLELRQNLIYLAQTQWGPALEHDKHVDSQMDRASKRIGENPQYFAGYVAPKSVPPAAAPDVQPPTVRETAAAVQQQMVASGEGAGVHDIAAMQAELAARAANESQQQSGVTVVKPGRVPAPAPSQSVIIDPSITTENPRDRKTVPEGRLAQAPAAPAPLEVATTQGTASVSSDSRHVKTVPPSTSRAQRPDIQLVRPDQEITQMDARKKAQARGNTITKWFKRGLLAAAAALGITAVGVGGYKAIQSMQSDDNTTASTETANQNPSTTSSPTAVASTAPSAAPTQSVADNQPAPTANPTSGPVTAPPNVTNPPSSVDHTHDVPTVVGSHTYGLGSSSGATVFTGTASQVEGGVDATPFASSLKTASWYETQQKSAELLLKIYDTNQSQLDKDVVSFVSANEATLRDLASQKDFTPFKFRTSFENRHGGQELFGSKGVYNTLLAFERIVDLYGNDTAKLLKDAPTIQLTIGSKLNAPEQRFAKAKLLTASANPATNPVNQGGKNGGGQPQNAPQGDGNGKSGFNDYTPGFHGGASAPGVIPANVLTPGQNVQYALEGAALQSDNLDVAFNALNASKAVKATDRKVARDYKVAREVQRHVAAEDRKIVDFEQKRRSRSFFTKVADFASNIWSGTTPEDREQGLRGIGGIRGFFMSDAQRQAEFRQRAQILEAAERLANVRKVPAQQPVASKVPEVVQARGAQVAADLEKSRLDIESSYAADQAREAEEKRKIAADLEQSRLDVEASYKADLAREAAAKKAALRSQLDAKMEKLFAKGRQMEAERGPAPAVDFRKTYAVAKADKSIKFVLERQIKLSNLGDEAKEKSLAVVQDMIRTNGAFIETYKMHADGSRDLTLKEEWRDKLKEAAGIQVASAEKVEEITEADFIEVLEDEKVAKAA